MLLGLAACETTGHNSYQGEDAQKDDYQSVRFLVLDLRQRSERSCCSLSFNGREVLNFASFVRCSDCLTLHSGSAVIQEMQTEVGWFLLPSFPELNASVIASCLIAHPDFLLVDSVVDFLTR
jgi:hypothetical protein